ncbi:hypothetical protein PHYBOEH_003253 [Phytophthora boehmeriae]|uniref:Peptidase A1 domain-containing protein n=1 Tax=Phytophthora boehmeriae TaxID=109152 RepID=A0A8T1X9T5_9STRA|nr:hypothetical protein PHYBOEH_003253 [Phytophthora boehmeriae]
MVRVLAGFPVVLAASVTLTALLKTQQTAGFTMELHRLPEHNIHPEKYARRLNSDEDGPEIVPLHIGLGTHYTWVYAGTPPQRASVIADTGSGIMAFPCSGCNGCGNHTDQPFEANNSSTLVHVTCSSDTFFQCKECMTNTATCGISQSYMEGSSWKASVVEDVVYLGGDSSFTDEKMRNQYGTHFQFGCQSSETGLFVTQVADGIMGLSNTNNHIVAKLYRENKISNNLFSLCFAEKGGTMSVGDPNTLAHRGEISYAKVITDHSKGHFYSVQMKDIRIGGKSIKADETAYTRGHYIVDSGTTDSYLPRAVKTEFLQLFKEVTGRDYQDGSTCTAFSKEDVKSLPTLQYVMEAYGEEGGEIILEVPPEQYLLATNNGNSFCGGIHLSENSGGVIGANIMTDRDVIFDLGNQRVGFVDADCMYQASMDARMSPTTTPAANDNGISSGSEENNLVPTKTTATVPTATPVAATTVAPTLAPTPAPTPTPTPALTPSPTASPTPTPNATPAPTPVASASPTPKVTDAVTREPMPVTTTAVSTASSTSQATDAATSQSLSSEAASNQTYTALSQDARPSGTQSSSSSATDISATKGGESGGGAHPMVLTIVGAVLVVGFLLMMLISVSRRRQNAGKEALWSRVKGSEEDEDDDDEEEFGLVRKEKKVTSKHQRLEMEEEDDDDDQNSSSDEEDEVFDRKNVQNDESKVDPRTLERL